MTKTITVQRMTDFGSRQWGVYVNGQLVEGGFFDKSAAAIAADRLRGCGTCGGSHFTSACPHRFGPPAGTAVHGAPDGV